MISPPEPTNISNARATNTAMTGTHEVEIWFVSAQHCHIDSLYMLPDVAWPAAYQPWVTATPL